MIKKPTYQLIIDGKEYLLLDYKVSHSVFTITSKAQLVIDKPVKVGSYLELSLGYDDNNKKVFWGQIFGVKKEGAKYKIECINTYELTKSKLKFCLKDVSPKEILGYIGLDLIYTKKNLQPKHHFIIWDFNKIQIIKKIIKTWNLKDFVYFFDLDKKLHFHHINEYWDKTVEIENFAIDNTSHSLKLPLTPGIFINQIVKVGKEKYKVLSVSHYRNNTYLEIENA